MLLGKGMTIVSGRVYIHISTVTNWKNNVLKILILLSYSYILSTNMIH